MERIINCPKCSGSMQSKTGRYGKYYQCSKCRNTENYSFDKRASGVQKYSPIDLNEFKLSHYQKEVLDFAKNQKENLIVNATAGSGKTFIQRVIAQRMPSNYNIMYATFDRRSVDDVKYSLPDNTEASTWHSFGYKQIRNHSRNGVRLNNKKNGEILKELVEKEDFYYREIISDNYSEILRLVSKAKNLLHETKLEALLGGSLMFTEEEEYLVRLSQRVLNESIKRAEREIDFDDMIFLPASGRVSVAKEFDLVLCDEAQDLNPAQIELVKMACNRTIIVGDKNQAIYLFRGADRQSMDLLKEHFQAVPLPLSITYRNPHAHVDYINNRLPHIAHEVNPENNEQGELGEISENDFLSVVEPNDLAICRLNAPLVPLALQLIREGKTAYVEGRDIGKGLIKLLNNAVKKKAKTNDFKDVIEAIKAHSSELIWKAESVGRNSNHLLDQRNTLLAVAEKEGINSAKDIEKQILILFGKDKPGVKLSTVHKAKGSEANNVFIVSPEKMPFPKGDIEEENNILFVALTRAKKKMNFVLGE